jgi:hypothetical protein
MLIECGRLFEYVSPHDGLGPVGEGFRSLIFGAWDPSEGRSLGGKANRW